jgi:hypothetical protein
MEGLRLRVKDVDFAKNQITVRDGNGPAVMNKHRGLAVADRAEKPSWKIRRKSLSLLP